MSFQLSEGASCLPRAEDAFRAEFSPDDIRSPTFARRGGPVRDHHIEKPSRMHQDIELVAEIKLHRPAEVAEIPFPKAGDGGIDRQHERLATGPLDALHESSGPFSVPVDIELRCGHEQ
jgi:hypothetical protein